MSQTKAAWDAFFAAYGRSGPWACGYCGDPVVQFSSTTGHVHHKDKNPKNNTPENLEAMHVLCHSHHHRKGKPGNRKGATVTPEVKARISAALKGRPAAHGYTPEVIEKMAAAHRGKPHVEPQLTCECGRTCHAGPMKRHQNASGHGLV